VNPIADSDVRPVPSVIRELIAVITPVVATTAVTDFLLWKSSAGVSMGILFAFVGTMLLLFRRGRPTVRLSLGVAALAVTCVQTGIEISLSNFLAGVMLILVVAGEVFQPHLAGFWARFSEAAFGLLSAPVRWFGFTGTVTRHLAELRVPNLGVVGAFVRLAWVIAPAVVLLALFAGIFNAGNAVFAEFTARIGRLSIEWLANLDLSPDRFVFWALVATVALGLFHGTPAPDAPRWWTRVLPRVPRPDYRLGAMQTGVVLIALNGLFCAVNSIDVVYLWRSGRLPAGVNHAEFVHAGVWSLISAVIFSAVIIAGMFQQQDRVVAGRWLKTLAHLWIAQNIVLIGGVFLRLKLYVDEYQLTEKRIYVGCFLALVTVGFLLLGWFVEKRKTFNWLLGKSMVATFFLFFALQFFDAALVVARHNVNRWLAASGSGKDAVLDVSYLASLGPGAWPQLRVVASSLRDQPTVLIARERLAEIRERESAAAATGNWREWQWRRAQARESLK
jgi:hypothetical protein